ncbi:thioredoxin family protein [uncultured Methanolobus sp.]|jgi:thioredoxin-like negative regulator of GroEL|uniref:thioredoxin family protein n=1 Tax=uncultured Methanolobus sp. TaxID=218300 RepID=UPI002AAB320F|nr:thioredoxin family protein [uncultured Methanolobus sp.]
MAESDIIEANDSNWAELIGNQEKPMVVMFYLPTCVHCKEIEPYFKDYSIEFHKSCTFVRMNGIDSPMTARKYGVRGTPTFKFFCKGNAIKEEVGLVYPSILRKAIEDLIRHGDECVLHTSPMPDEVSPYE